MGYSWTKEPLEIAPPVCRFFTDIEKAKEGARILFSRLKIKEAIFILKSIYGTYGTKREEFSLRLKSEGLRIDSDAIVYKLNYDSFKN